jgi:hypothetical protein
MRLLQVLHHQLLCASKAGCDVLCTCQCFCLGCDALLPSAKVWSTDQLLPLLGRAVCTAAVQLQCGCCHNAHCSWQHPHPGGGVGGCLADQRTHADLDTTPHLQQVLLLPLARKSYSSIQKSLVRPELVSGVKIGPFSQRCVRQLLAAASASHSFCLPHRSYSA